MALQDFALALDTAQEEWRQQSRLMQSMLEQILNPDGPAHSNGPPCHSYEPSSHANVAPQNQPTSAQNRPAVANAPSQATPHNADDVQTWEVPAAPRSQPPQYRANHAHIVNNGRATSIVHARSQIERSSAATQQSGGWKGDGVATRAQELRAEGLASASPELLNHWGVPAAAHTATASRGVAPGAALRVQSQTRLPSDAQVDAILDEATKLRIMLPPARTDAVEWSASGVPHVVPPPQWGAQLNGTSQDIWM